MSRREIKDPAASVRQRLLDLSRQRGEDFLLVATRFALERFLYRLSRSRHADRFILKGAMLFAVWADKPHRPTRDIDLLGIGDSSADGLTAAARDICAAPVEPDGLLFDADGIRVEEIRDGQEYPGQRIKLPTTLDTVRLTLQIDVGFGDAITPGPREIEYPVLLDHPAPHILAYPQETTVAEKLEALVVLGMPNSRMKDFFDLWTMSEVFTFEGPMLVKAIQATFQRRRTDIPKDVPTGLSDEFGQDAGKARQWKAFVESNGLETGGAGLPSVIADLREFLLKPLKAAAADREFRMFWSPGGPWRG